MGIIGALRVTFPASAYMSWAAMEDQAMNVDGWGHASILVKRNLAQTERDPGSSNGRTLR